MKLLVIGDIHTHYEKAERIIKKFNDYKIIFVGDYFDQFNDTVVDNECTAEWLKSSLENPNRIHLKGNHDEHYDPRVNIFCSGYTGDKKKAINNVLSIEDWNKLKYFHFENNWWFSHAGITNHWFSHPLKNTIDFNSVEKVIDDAITRQRIGDVHNAIWASDNFRGGPHPKGGILWCDWRNLDLIPNFNQVVGHTPVHKIISIHDEVIRSRIINVDCSAITYMGEVLEIDEKGSVKVIDTSYV